MQKRPFLARKSEKTDPELARQGSVGRNARKTKPPMVGRKHTEGRSSGTSGANQYPPRHEIKEIRVLSQRESGIEGPVPKDLIDCEASFLAAVMS